MSFQNFVLRCAELTRRMFGHHFPPLGSVAFRTFYRVMPRAAEVELFPGIRVNMRFSDTTHAVTYWQGARFEAPTMYVVADWMVSDTEAFFDIGANYGFFSYWISHRAPRVGIFAFEPHPRNIATMEEAKRRNGLTQLHPQQLALGETSARLKLNCGQDDLGHSTLGPHPGLKDEGIEVDVVSFDEWRRQRGLALPESPCWVAKIDVEGFELHVLRGMKEALAARAFRGLMVELNPFTLSFCGTSVDEVCAFLKASGYERVFPRNTSGNSKGLVNGFFVPASNCV